tara:strand:+ start:244 stop:738 length:495 start_codon:yes stop_codon:yes gene_type:complete
MVSSTDLRQAFGQFGTGVAIIALQNNDNQSVGLTVNSFASVSLQPPLLSWCLANNSQLFDDVAQANRFSVNVLAADQLALSNRMSGASSHVLQNDEFDESVHGTPLLRGALAQFDCHIHERVELGDHIMFVGGIDTVRHCSQGRAPLIYFRGNYAGIDVGARNG